MSGLIVSLSSHISVRAGTTDTSCNTALEAGERRAARDSTASRTVTGTPGSLLASASVTKKGLPPVTV